MILGLDPGNKESAWVLYDPMAGNIRSCGKQKNSEVLKIVREWCDPRTSLVIERIACYGMAVGDEVFETCVWTGRFIQAWAESPERSDAARIPRKYVKLHLCGSMRAKDGNVMTALMDKFGGKGCKGTKKNPGPLYGIAGDQWSALAVAVTFAETHAAPAAQMEAH